MFAGGPVSDRNGNKLIASGVNIKAAYGGTEFGSVTLLLQDGDRIPLGPDVSGAYGDTVGNTCNDEIPEVSTNMAAEDWSWMAFSPRVKPRWEPQGDGTYELHFLVRYLNSLEYDWAQFAYVT